MITTSDGEIYEDETAHALGVQMAMTDPLDRNNPRPGRVQGEGGGGGMDPVHFRSPEDAKFRLDQLLRDKASTKKSGYPVEGQEYAPYNNQIRQLRDFLKGQPKSENDEKPVIDKSSGDDVVTLAMNMENIQPSKHTQIRGVIADALTNFRNSLPHTNIEDMGEGVVPKESGLSQTMVKGLTSTGDRAVKRVDKMELNALDFQKKMDDWVANGNPDDPIPDPF